MEFYNKNIINILVCLSGFLIVFSFIAPIIFTQCSLCIDFSDKGEIGDVIGGLMNPFIAIAGVLSTFLAFLMQFRANKIQQEQFNEVQKEKREQEKLDRYYNLKLIGLIIQNCSDDLNNNISSIKQFLESIKEKPFCTEKIKITNPAVYNRLLDFNRQDIYKSFISYVRNICDKWDLKYDKMYSIIEILPSLLIGIQRMIEIHSQDIYKEELDILRELTRLRKEFDDLLEPGCSKDLGVAVFFFASNYNAIKKIKLEDKFVEIREFVGRLKDNIERNRYSIKEFNNNHIERLDEILVRIDNIEIKVSSLKESIEEIVKDLECKLEELTDVKCVVDLGIEKSKNIIGDCGGINKNAKYLKK